MPARVGHTFSGWYTAKSGGTKITASTVFTAATDQVLFARWTTLSYTVSFDSAGGSPVPSQTVEYGSRAVRPKDPSRAGYAFVGWYTRDGKTFDFRAPVRADARLAARWRMVFRDVTSSTPHADDIGWLADAGVSEGWREPDGSRTFRGMDSVKRQDMAAFLYRLAGKPASPESSNTWIYHRYVDVNESTPHCHDIYWLTLKGISEGWVYTPPQPPATPSKPSQPSQPAKPSQPSNPPATVYYKNYTEVRKAGKAPLYRRDPGYRSALDGDDDGIACEMKR